MIIIPVQEGEAIERALKRFKRKWRDRKIVQELRERQAFIKPTVKKRKQKQKAIYLQEKYNRENL